MEIEDVEFVDSVTLVGTPSHKRQLAKAQMEGRLHPDLAVLMGVETGQYVCPTCGMRAWTLEVATACCEGALLCPQRERMEVRSHKKDGGQRASNDPGNIRVGKITDHVALYDAVRAAENCRGLVARGIESKFDLHGGYMTKLLKGRLGGVTQRTYISLVAIFGGEPPFVELKKRAR